VRAGLAEAPARTAQGGVGAPDRTMRAGDSGAAAAWKKREARLLAGQRTAAAFAERLSLHGDPRRAAAEIGKSRTYGLVLLRRIRAGLGWQAR
jgi:hypothetical protein